MSEQSDLLNRHSNKVNSEGLPQDSTDPGELRHFGNGKSEDFDWENDESVVIQAQTRTAVHTNTRNQICVRQEASWRDEERDPHMVFNVESAGLLVSALALELSTAGGSPGGISQQLRRIAARLTAAAGQLEEKEAAGLWA